MTRCGTIFLMIDGREVRFNLDIDIEGLIQTHGKRALRTKTGVTKLGHGAIVIQAVK